METLSSETEAVVTGGNNQKRLRGKARSSVWDFMPPLASHFGDCITRVWGGQITHSLRVYPCAFLWHSAHFIGTFFPAFASLPWQSMQMPALAIPS